MRAFLHNSRHKISLLLITLTMIPLFLVTKSVMTVFTQIKDNREKKVKKRSAPNEPVEIVGLKNNQRSIKVDEVFLQDIDWLKDFTIKYKNNSGKNVIWLSVALDFPETKTTGNIMVFPINSGANPLISPPTQRIQPIKPGETIELTVDPKKYEKLKAFIGKRHQLNNLSEVDLRIDFILFDDGTGWTAGNMVHPDPNDPLKWVPFNSN